MMKVLFWSPAFWPELGGVQLFGVQLIRALRTRGYEFCVVTRRYTPSMAARDSFEGVPIYRFPFRDALSSGRLEDVIDVRRGVTELKTSFAPDLVHLNEAGVDVFFHHASAAAHPSPTLLTLHGLWPDRTRDQDSVMARALRAADSITCCSEAVLNEARLLVPEIATRSCVITNARKEPDVVPVPLPTNEQRLVFLGRLSPEKGFDVALAAFARIAGRFSELRLIVAGDGPDRSKLENQARELGVSDRVDFLGWIEPDAVPTLLNSASIVLMPSRSEGFPLAALDAALMGRPVVATTAGGLAEAVQDGVTGLLVPPDDSVAFAAAIGRLLGEPETVRKMGAAARERVRRTFSWESHVDAFDSQYRQLTA